MIIVLYFLWKTGEWLAYLTRGGGGTPSSIPKGRKICSPYSTGYHYDDSPQSLPIISGRNINTINERMADASPKAILV